MEKRQNTKWYLLRSFLLISLLSMAFSIPAFAANKALGYTLDFKGTVLSDKSTDAQWDACCYDLGVYTDLKTTLTSTVERSGDIIIPAKMFKNKNSRLDIFAELVVHETDEPDYEWIGSYGSTREFRVFGDGRLDIYNGVTHKFEKPKNGISIKKKSGYYILHFVDTINIKKNELILAEGKQIDMKKNVNLGMNFILVGNGIKKGTVYVDNLNIKTSKVNALVTFDKKDYRDWGYKWRGNYEFVFHSPKAKVVKRPA